MAVGFSVTVLKPLAFYHCLFLPASFIYLAKHEKQRNRENHTDCCISIIIAMVIISLICMAHLIFLLSLLWRGFWEISLQYTLNQNSTKPLSFTSAVSAQKLSWTVVQNTPCAHHNLHQTVYWMLKKVSGDPLILPWPLKFMLDVVTIELHYFNRWRHLLCYGGCEFMWYFQDNSTCVIHSVYLHQWLSARLQYLHCQRAGEAVFLH